ncbi:MAG: DUF1428 family protein [Pseudoalteromonas prydzensis]|uniref:DUF1428 family protein n=1 Tax=Pseudoalteromonas TaxID=53246 RepID=UPI002658D8A4|nr:DUF1428 family protein [Pseudoalteromonas sp. KG3]WKD26270.1 DUF1428 domain-containing protein [Pseudoalteromonas sp. KG3]
MSYIDGFVCAVPTHRQAEYAEHADKAAQVFKQCGAIEVIEAWVYFLIYGSFKAIVTR